MLLRLRLARCSGTPEVRLATVLGHFVFLQRGWTKGHFEGDETIGKVSQKKITPEQFFGNQLLSISRENEWETAARDAKKPSYGWLFNRPAKLGYRPTAKLSGTSIYFALKYSPKVLACLSIRWFDAAPVPNTPFI